MKGAMKIQRGALVGYAKQRKRLFDPNELERAKAFT
jgi:hypothetical protein